MISNNFGGVGDPEYREVIHRMWTPELEALPAEQLELSAWYRSTNPEGTRRWVEIRRAARRDDEAASSPLDRVALDALTALRMPVFMLAGDANLLAPPGLMRMMAARVPGCRFTVVPESGHSSFWEQPEVWNRTVLEFIDEHP